MSSLIKTEKTLALLLAYAKDAGNWSGTPLVGGNVIVFGAREDRGYLTHAKKLGWVTTFISDGDAWVKFTDEGKRVADLHGVNLDDGCDVAKAVAS